MNGALPVIPGAPDWSVCTAQVAATVEDDRMRRKSSSHRQSRRRPGIAGRVSRTAFLRTCATKSPDYWDKARCLVQIGETSRAARLAALPSYQAVEGLTSDDEHRPFVMAGPGPSHSILSLCFHGTIVDGRAEPGLRRTSRRAD